MNWNNDPLKLFNEQQQRIFEERQEFARRSLMNQEHTRQLNMQRQQENQRAVESYWAAAGPKGCIYNP